MPGTKTKMGGNNKMTKKYSTTWTTAKTASVLVSGMAGYLFLTISSAFKGGTILYYATQVSSGLLFGIAIIMILIGLFPELFDNIGKTKKEAKQ